jgi:transcription antitermination factor NusG
MKGWFVVKTHHQREKWACENIARQGATFYLPQVLNRTRLRGRKTEAEGTRCLFPGYLFVKTAGQWRFLLGTFGVAAVIMQGQQPALLPDWEVDRLKNSEVDGLVVLPKEALMTERFKTGERVRVADGLFSGCTGIYEGSGPKECERVLLDFLGRKTAVLIGSQYLQSEKLVASG